jgi:hypothetical protein
MGVAFVVVSHQPSGHVSLLPDLLQKHTALPVVEATDGMRVAPNHVYLSAPGRSLAMLQGALHVMEPHSDGRAALPIDYFFRSLAEDQGDRAIGVILSGTGTDGTLGLKAIKAHAGMTMAQEPQVAKYAGMPESAIRSGAVDYVRPAGSMVEQIRTFLTGVAGRDAQRQRDDRGGACNPAPPIRPVGASFCTDLGHSLPRDSGDRGGSRLADQLDRHGMRLTSGATAEEYCRSPKHVLASRQLRGDRDGAWIWRVERDRWRW